MIEALANDTLVTVATDVTGNAENLMTKTVKDWRKTAIDLPKLPTVFALLGQRECGSHKTTEPKVFQKTPKTARFKSCSHRR